MTQRLIDRFTLGLRLHTLRFATPGRPSAKEVADGSQVVSESTLLRWEQAEEGGHPDPAKLARLCAFYGAVLHADVQVADLLDPDFDMRVWLIPAVA